MKKKCCILIFVFSSLTNILLGQYIQVTFRDVLAPNTTADRVLSENPTYGISPNPPLEERWLIKLYKSTDSVINPLDINNNPTGDDIMITDPYNQNATQYLSIVNSGSNIYVTMLAIRFYHEEQAVGQAWIGDMVYLRVFNAHTIAASTKHMVFYSMYTVPNSNAYVEMDGTTTQPSYGWSDWMYNPSVSPNPPNLIAPANYSTGLNIGGVQLTWQSNAGAQETGFKVYLGTDNPPEALIADVADTTIITGALPVPGTYYWKVVPYNSGGHALNCPVWSFSAVVYPPLANFSVDITEQLEPLIAHFTDLSSAGSGILTTWLWNFGDGNTSTEQNPVHTYTDDGIYTVSLSVNNSYNAEDDTVRTGLIHVLPRFPVSELYTTPPLEFGEVYLGSQSEVLNIWIRNSGTSPLIIDSLFFNHTSSYFTAVNTILPMQIEEAQLKKISVAFIPQHIGAVNDTINIVSNSVNQPIIAFGMSGTGAYVPPKLPENISISINNGNAVISWDSVTENVNDVPITPTGYIILYSEDDYNYFFLWETPDTVFVHYRVAQFRQQMFYKVIAYLALSREQNELMHNLKTRNEKITELDLQHFLYCY